MGALTNGTLIGWGCTPQTTRDPSVSALMKVPSEVCSPNTSLRHLIKTPPCPTTPGDNPCSSQHEPDRSFQALLQDQALHGQGNCGAEGAPPALALNPQHPHPARTDQGTLPPTFLTEKHQVVQAPPGSDTKILLLNAAFWQTSSSPAQTPSSQCCKGEKGGWSGVYYPSYRGWG